MAERKRKDGRAANGGPRPKTRANDRRGAHKGDEGQAPFVPTPEQREIVRTYAVVLDHEKLAKKMGLSVSTLLRHFREEIDEAMVDITAEFGARVVKIGRNEAHPKHAWALAYFLNTRGGWRRQIGISAGDGEPVIPREKMAELLGMKGMSDDELQRLVEGLAVLAGGSSGESDAGP